MPKVRPLYRHTLEDSRFVRYELERPGVHYTNHFVVLKNPGHGPHMFFCGHCGELHPAIRIAFEKTLETEISVAIERDSFFSPMLTASIPDENLYLGNKELVFAEFHSEDPLEGKTKDEIDDLQLFDEEMTIPNLDISPVQFEQIDLTTQSATKKNYFPNKYRARRKDNEIVSFKCKGCGEYIAAPEVQVINEKTKDHDKSSIVWVDVVDLDEDKIRFRWITRTASAWRGKMQFKSESNTITVNTRTGHAYLLAPFERGKIKKGYHGPKLRTVTHTASRHIDSFLGVFGMPTIFMEQLAHLVEKKIAMRTPYPMKTIIDYFHEYNAKEDAKAEAKRLRHAALFPPGPAARTVPPAILNKKKDTFRYSFDLIFTYNRFPGLNSFIMRELVDHFLSKGNRKSLEDAEKTVKVNKIDTRFSKVKNDDPDPVGALLKAFSVPANKTFRKLVRNDHSEISRIASVTANFKEIANVRKLLDAPIFAGDGLHVWLSPNWNFFRANEHQITPKKFISLMIREHGETIVANKIAAVTDEHFLKDAYSSYIQIKDKAPDMKLSFQGTIREIHDRFAEIYDGLAHPNIPIEYVEAEKSIETQIGDYMIYLGRDTKELRTVGRMMGICVGGYGNRAVSKSLYIALVVDIKNPDKYQVCIEMDARRKVIHQAKIRSNKLLHNRPELHEVVLQWIEQNDLLVDTYDLKELKEEHKDKVYDFARSGYRPPWIVEKMEKVDSALAAVAREENVVVRIDPVEYEFEEVY